MLGRCALNSTQREEEEGNERNRMRGDGLIGDGHTFPGATDVTRTVLIMSRGGRRGQM
jgi:hypothetical protein